MAKILIVMRRKSMDEPMFGFSGAGKIQFVTMVTENPSGGYGLGECYDVAILDVVAAFELENQK